MLRAIPVPALALLVCAIAIGAAPADGPGPIRIADEIAASIASPHPYAGTSTGARESAWSHVLHRAGASYVAVRIAAIDLAPGDELVLTDPAGRYRHVYRGRGLNESGGGFWALSILGDTMHVAIETQSTEGHGHFGVTIDRIAYGFPTESPPEIEAVCGPEDFRDIECYKDTYPQAYQKGRAAVRLIKNGSAHCTGWLASCENHIITNEHCVGSQSELDQIEFQFEYKRPGCNAGTATVELQLQGGTLLEVDPGLDYAFIMPELAGHDPQATYGFMQWETRLPDVGELMYIPGHPSGDPKRLSIESTHPSDPGVCDVHSVSEPPCTGGPVPEVGYYCDTEGGSSGSPVLSYETHKVIALHHCANCPNRGVPIVDVYNDIQASAHPLPACSTCQPVGVPQDLVASSPEDNAVNLSWAPVDGAAAYVIHRSPTSCDEGMVAIGRTTETTYLDEDVGGGITYYYRVASESICGALSPLSECAIVTPSGECTEPPTFDGLVTAETSRTSECGIDLTWSAATARCGAARYNVYRSTVPDFVPGPGNLVASCVALKRYTDTTVLPGTDYFYVVRAEDEGQVGGGPCNGGNEEQNTVARRSEATGPDTIFYTQDFETQIGWVLTGEWQITAPLGLGGASAGGLGNPDPQAAAFGSGVLGVDLTGKGNNLGNYENGSNGEFAASPLIDGTGHDEVRVRFWRWLNVQRQPQDRAIFEVCDALGCDTAWANPTVDMWDDAWQVVDVDATARLANSAQGRVRFGLQSDGSGHASGWNVDRLEVYEPSTCLAGSANIAPIPDGHFASGAAMTASRAADGRIELAWDSTRCQPPVTNLFYADASSLATYAYDGALCAVGASGSATVAIPDPAPGSFTWWVLGGAQGSTEGIHGYTSTGAIRAANAGGRCGVIDQSTAGFCP